jgi:hypothetical protein
VGIEINPVKRSTWRDINCCSGHEAQWAVYFTWLDQDFMYEPRSFALDDGQVP